MATKEYDFHYMPDVGKLPGMTFEQQTEDAINDIGIKSLTAEETANSALETANKALDQSQEAINTANDAQTAAENAQATADAANTAASNAQDTADEALEKAEAAQAGVTDNTAGLETIQNTVNEYTTIIQQVQVDVSEAQLDITDLESTVSAMQTSLNTLSMETTTYRETDETDADELENVGRWLITADTANIPEAVAGLMDVWTVDEIVDDEGETTQAGGIVQRFQSQEDGAMWVRFGTDNDSEEEDAPAYVFSEWYRITADVSSLTDEEVQSIWDENHTGDSSGTEGYSGPVVGEAVVDETTAGD